MNKELTERYGASAHGNFRVTDTIGVPHSYCIGAKHVSHAADHFNGMLGNKAIKSGEAKGIKCATCKGKLSFEEHKTALLVECALELQTDGVTNPELQEYLIKCKPLCEEDKRAGFAFVLA